MTSPVQLSDLTPAGTADNADETLLRKSGTTDYRVSIDKIRNINVGALPSLTSPSSPVFDDLLMISRAGVNYQTQFGSVGFTVGTRIWFYQNSEPVSPLFWQIVPNTGDTLLAVKGGATYTSGIQGDWQQVNHTLTIDQIPAHSHDMIIWPSSDLGGRIIQGKISSCIRDAGSNTATTNSTGGGLPHNHGNTWRPLACVGIICEKVL